MFTEFGHHIDCAYSRWGQTKVAYSVQNESGFRFSKLLLIRPNIEFALLTCSLMCSSKFKSELISTPRFFSRKTWSNSFPSSLYVWACLMLLNFPIVNTWHLSGWNSNSHCLDQLSRLLVSFCIAKESLIELTSSKIFVSMAKRNAFQLTCIGRSLI